MRDLDPSGACRAAAPARPQASDRRPGASCPRLLALRRPAAPAHAGGQPRRAGPAFGARPARPAAAAPAGARPGGPAGPCAGDPAAQAPALGAASPARGRELAAGEELAAGRVVRIGGRSCHVTAPLGKGSFGVVWAARCDGAGEVAVKEIECRTDEEFSRACHEAALLQRLGPLGGAGAPEARRGGAARGRRIPGLVAVEGSAGSARPRWLRFAMSRLPGRPLDQWLEGRRGAGGECSRLSCGALPEGQVGSACSYARALVSQLLPPMQGIALLAYHRDVNAHNVLVSCHGPAGPEFGLVDFGLAVDAAGWRDASPANPGGKSEWRLRAVAGDCRYWPASAWLQFTAGQGPLSENQALCQEYQAHLDLQGLGLTALQLLCQLLPAPPALAPELARLAAAWAKYWEDASRWWDRLLKATPRREAWAPLQAELASRGVHDTIAGRLAAVRAALRGLDEACRRGRPPRGLEGASGLVGALLLLVSAGEPRPRPASWEDVRAALEAVGGAGPGPPPSPGGTATTWWRSAAGAPCASARCSSGGGTSGASSPAAPAGGASAPAAAAQAAELPRAEAAAAAAAGAGAPAQPRAPGAALAGGALLSRLDVFTTRLGELAVQMAAPEPERRQSEGADGGGAARLRV